MRSIDPSLNRAGLTGPDRLAWLTRTPFAHRGLHGGPEGRIENSMSAFRTTLDAGFGIELDVQLTRDGQAVVFHDDRLDRLTDSKGRVANQTLADLLAIPLAGSGDHVPSLKDVLGLVGGTVPLLIEIKGSSDPLHRLEKAVAQALRHYRGPAAVMSFAPGVVAWFRDHCTDMVRGFVASTRYRFDLGWRLSQPSVHKRLVRDLDPAFVAYDIRSLPNTFTRGWREAGRPLLTWTVRSAAQHRRARQHTDNIIFEQA